jgi:hypothetical protein
MRLKPARRGACENAIRPFTVGRKNWLFYDTVAVASAVANLYPLIQTRKVNSVEPFAYLVALSKRLPRAQSANDYEALLSWPHQTNAQPPYRREPRGPLRAYPLTDGECISLKLSY